MFYQHKDGGWYRLLFTSKSTVDQSEWVVYEHIWPFDKTVWHRPAAEFNDGRFTPKAYNELEILQRTINQTDARAQIATAKAARKASEVKVATHMVAGSVKVSKPDAVIKVHEVQLTDEGKAALTVASSVDLTEPKKQKRSKQNNVNESTVDEPVADEPTVDETDVKE